MMKRKHLFCILLAGVVLVSGCSLNGKKTTAKDKTLMGTAADNTETESNTETETSTQPESKTGVLLEKKNTYCLRRYEEIINATITEFGYGQYYLHDMNQDGQLDLIVGWGESESDYQNTLYMEMENGEVEAVGSFYGDGTLYQSEDGNGIDIETQRMGTLRVRKISLKGNELVDEVLLEQDDITGTADYNNPNVIEGCDCYDMTLLDNMR